MITINTLTVCRSSKDWVGIVDKLGECSVGFDVKHLPQLIADLQKIQSELNDKAATLPPIAPGGTGF